LVILLHEKPMDDPSSGELLFSGIAKGQAWVEDNMDETPFYR
jgi:hypothetical protein